MPNVNAVQSRVEEPATERQRAYATALGCRYPPDISKAAISELITKAEDKDNDPNPGLMDFARSRGISFSPYIGKRALYNRVFDTLPDDGKASFFVFSVYRWVSGDRGANLDVSPFKEDIECIARKLLADPAAAKSLIAYQGQDLRFFGEARFGDILRQGGSNRTSAYRAAVAGLKARHLIPPGPVRRRETSEVRTTTTLDYGTMDPAAMRFWSIALVVGALVACGGGYWVLRAVWRFLFG